MKDTIRMLKMICRLARRGAWIGVRRFIFMLFYGLTHRHCKRCAALKGINAHQFCYPCRYDNFMAALADVDDEDDEDVRLERRGMEE